MSQDYFC